MGRAYLNSLFLANLVSCAEIGAGDPLKVVSSLTYLASHCSLVSFFYSLYMVSQHTWPFNVTWRSHSMDPLLHIINSTTLRVNILRAHSPRGPQVICKEFYDVTLGVEGCHFLISYWPNKSLHPVPSTDYMEKE